MSIHPELVRVPVDTHHYHESPKCPAIAAEVVARLDLRRGQEVIAYMPPDPEDVWLAVVRHDPNLPEPWQWWVEIVE